jgi:hypothetical protein
MQHVKPPQTGATIPRGLAAFPETGEEILLHRSGYRGQSLGSALHSLDSVSVLLEERSALPAIDVPEHVTNQHIVLKPSK